MTKENREKQYAHFRDLEKNYTAREGLDSGPTATQSVRANAKISADAILAKHPELEAEKAEVKEPEVPKETKSKGKK